MAKKSTALVFSYSDKFATLMLWWKAVFGAPVWLYPMLPFLGSVIAYLGDLSLQLTYFFIIAGSMVYFLQDILKRKIRIENGVIIHGFRSRQLSKILSIGTVYKSNDILPRKMVLTFAGGKSMSFFVNRFNAGDYQQLLKHMESHYPQCQIDPVLNNLIACKKVARKVLVDDGNKFIIEYKGGQLWRNMHQSFWDTALPWIRFGPLFIAVLMAHRWLNWTSDWLYMPMYGRRGTETLQDWLTQTIMHALDPFYRLTETTARTFMETSANPVVAAMSFSLLAYLSFFLLRALVRPNSLNIDASGLTLALSIAGNSIPRGHIQWDKVQTVCLEKSQRSGAAKIKFQMREGKPFFLDFAAVQVNDRPRLARALERFAPGCTIEAELNEAMLPNRERSYTELWMQSLSSAPERNSMQSLTPGLRLHNDRYKVLKRLGVGGQGTAYLCRDEIENCDVVLKETIVPAYADRALREQALKGFEKEAKILESLDCPGIVRLRDYFFEDHRGYIGLEHISGQNLRQVVETSGPLSEEKALALAAHMCKILSYLHERSIIHRDFTPDNLILTEDNVLKLIDFNVAQLQQVGTTGTIAGKHSYLPPEQFRGKATCQSDIYAMGATLQFLVSGKDPEAISQSSPLEAGLEVSQGFDQIVRSCTNLDLKKRYATVADIETAMTGGGAKEAPVAEIETEAKAEGESLTIKIPQGEREKMEA